MRHDVEQIIRQQQWSPEQIVGRFRLEGIPIVGKTTLYTFLHKNKEKRGWGPLSSYETPSKISPQAFSFSPKREMGTA